MAPCIYSDVTHKALATQDSNGTSGRTVAQHVARRDTANHKGFDRSVRAPAPSETASEHFGLKTRGEGFI